MRLKRSITPGVVLVTSLLLTVLATSAIAAASRTRTQARFENAIQSAQDRVAARLDTYVAILRGGAGLFSASREVTRAEFRAFEDRVGVRERYPGIQGIGFSARVPADRVDSLVTAMEEQGYPGFAIRPDTPRAEYHAIVYLEPLDARNRIAIGFDMFSEATRRAAMVRAREHGLPALSGRVTLVQEVEPAKQAGFLIYLPVYRGGIVPATVEQRRDDLVGFVYAPFRADDLFAGIFGTEREPRVLFQVFDGPVADPERLLHDSRPADRRDDEPLFADTTALTLAGRQWTVVYESSPWLEQSASDELVPVTMGIGTVISLLLFVLTRAEARARLRAEEAAEEAKAANEAKSQFLATMSHELRTPLNAIGGYTELLDLGIHGPVTPEQSHALSRITSAQRHLLALINDVLNYAKLEAGRVSFRIEEVSVAEVVATVEGLVEPQLGARHLRFVREGCDRGLMVRADSDRVQQVLLNLLTNAIKFTDPGGVVRVRCEPGEDQVALRVIDTGRGIPADRLEAIFDPFVQVDRHRTQESQQGVGLGLSISRDLARAMGGDLSASSVEGEGATFTLVLPRAARGRAIPPPPETPR